MKEKLIEQLKSKITSGTKQSLIEKEIPLPKNSLCNVLSGKKEMPDKWVGKIIEYLSTVSSAIPGRLEVSGPLAEVLEKMAGIAPAIDLNQPVQSWAESVRLYCLKKGLMPDQLVKFHEKYEDLAPIMEENNKKSTAGDSFIEKRRKAAQGLK